jgi:hypothetical protein
MLDVLSIDSYLPRWGHPGIEDGSRFDGQAHPQDATGVAKCVELSQRLRGVAMNQVDVARIALEHNTGGPATVSAVTSLGGPANGS